MQGEEKEPQKLQELGIDRSEADEWDLRDPLEILEDDE